MILLIDTATKICSVSIAKAGQILTIQENREGFSHASQLTILIQKACEAVQIQLTDLDAVAVSIGPGSYTGLRIGLSTAKGICFALSKPLIAIDTLEALFSASKLDTDFKNALYVPMIDARRMEVYTVFYDKNNLIIQPKQSFIINENSFSELLNQYDKVVLSGDGAEKCKTILNNEQFHYTEIICSAKHLAPLAFTAFQNKNFADLAYIEPTYFKPPNITKPKSRL